MQPFSQCIHDVDSTSIVNLSNQNCSWKKMGLHEAFLTRNLLQTLLFSLYTFDIHLARADFETTNGSQQKVGIFTISSNSH